MSTATYGATASASRRTAAPAPAACARRGTCRRACQRRPAPAQKTSRIRGGRRYAGVASTVRRRNASVQRNAALPRVLRAARLRPAEIASPARYRSVDSRLYRKRRQRCRTSRHAPQARVAAAAGAKRCSTHVRRQRIPPGTEVHVSRECQPQKRTVLLSRAQMPHAEKDGHAAVSYARQQRLQTAEIRAAGVNCRATVPRCQTSNAQRAAYATARVEDETSSNGAQRAERYNATPAAPFAAGMANKQDVTGRYSTGQQRGCVAREAAPVQWRR